MRNSRSSTEGLCVNQDFSSDSEELDGVCESVVACVETEMAYVDMKWTGRPQPFDGEEARWLPHDGWCDECHCAETN